MARVYLAGKWEEAEIIREHARKIREAGHTITEPWFETHTGDNVPCLQYQAIKDVEGVEQCDTFVGIFERILPYSGAIAEFGMAVVLKKRIFLLGHALDKNIFVNIPGVRTYWNFDHLVSDLGERL